MTLRRFESVTLLLCGVLAATSKAATPLGTAFTYQGRLVDDGNPASGVYDLTFTLYDAVSGGGQVGTAWAHSSTPTSGPLAAAKRRPFDTATGQGSPKSGPG